MHYYDVYYAGKHEVMAAKSPTDVRAYLLQKGYSPKHVRVDVCPPGTKILNPNITKILPHSRHI